MKKLTWLHLSDIHFNPKTTWRDNTSIDGLLKYLTTEFSQGNLPKPDLIFCTGDIAFGEVSGAPLADQYSKAAVFFDRLLIACGSNSQPLPKERLFLVPGNHDVNRKKINSDAQAALHEWAKNPHVHVSKINQRFNDKTLELTSAMIRLDEYGEFIKKYLPHQYDSEGRHHYTYITQINGIEVGIAGFNSAWTCAGPEDDRNIWMAANWQFNKANEKIHTCDIKIGLIHHPIDWLNQADRDLANKTVCQQYDFWLHGHAHNAWVIPTQSHITIAAGAVGAEQSEEFGVNISEVNLDTSEGCAHLLAKKFDSDWTISPIPNFAPFGVWSFELTNRLRSKIDNLQPKQSSTANATSDLIVITERHLENRFKESLKLFSGQISEWVDPIIAIEPENKSRNNPDAVEKIPLESIITPARDIFICAPAQYGQTSLAHFLIKESWSKHKKFWLYLDAKSLKANKDSIARSTERELELSARKNEEICCVILDSWSPEEKDSQKLINKIYEYFSEIPVICMQYIPDSITRIAISTAPRSPEILHLWSLSRENIRKIVSAYNDKSPIGDESTITSRIISDMEILNLHRTPLNCLTLLKVSEIDFDENPVNRTEIIKRVLFLLFNIDELPAYKTRPDLKDCEHVLGYLCEQLMREGSYGFTRDRFLSDLQRHAKSQLMDLETQLVFDILYKNNIIVQRGDLFYFKFSYWLFYFAAQRMHHNDEFASFIMNEMRYTQHPELIEFYTGIDRKREDALKILIKDLSYLREEVQKSCGLPESLNPYRLGKWTPSDEATERMQQEVANGVAESNLPDEIKDKYADRNYDHTRPYNQVAGSILQEHHFVNLIQAIRASSRALRNSDYANIELKRELLNEILKDWEQVTRIILTVLPILTEQSKATYDGVSIVLLAETPEEESLHDRFFRILSYIPYSVAREFSDDLFSMKMGPLLNDRLNSPDLSELNRHELILMIVNKRPRDWQKIVSRYIAQIQHNSFYLLDVYENLRAQYRYAFLPQKALGEIEHLIKMAAAKHVSGSKSPNSKLIGKVKNSDVIPNREVSP